MTSRKGLLLALALLLLGVLLYVLRGNVLPRREDQVEIGAILPLTGSGAQYGEDARRGIELALGGLGHSKGKLMDIVYEDSRTDPKTGVSTFQKLLSVNRVPAVITEVSGVVLALAPIANRNEVVLFNMGAQNPDIANAGSYVFSNINLANVESRQIAEFASNELHVRKAAILYANVAYGEGARKVFSDVFKRMGGQVVAEVAFPEDGLDYRAQVLQVMEAHPDAVYLPGHTKDMARILKQGTEIGFHPQWLSYTAFEGQEILDIAGPAAEGVIYSSLSLDTESGSSTMREFRDAYQQRYGMLPGIYSATAYDATLILAEAINAGSRSGAQIRQFLSRMEPFEGASGLTSFDAKGTVNKPVVFKTVKDGQFVKF